MAEATDFAKIIGKIKNMRYPISHSTKEILGSSLFIAITGYLFLVIFQPFGAYTYQHRYKYLLLVPYALIAFVTYSVVTIWLKKHYTKWSLYNEASKIFYILVICSVLNYIYNIYFINLVPFSITHLLSMFFYTFSIAVPVSMIYVLGRYIYLSNFQLVSKEPTIAPSLGKKFSIQPDAGAGAIKFDEDSFLYAESDGNYSTIYYLNKGNTQKQLLRLSLKNLEKQLESSNIFRCHRSYIINMSKVTKMKGNAQGYKLCLEKTDVIIPVSRTYIAALKQY